MELNSTQQSLTKPPGKKKGLKIVISVLVIAGSLFIFWEGILLGFYLFLYSLDQDREVAEKTAHQENVCAEVDYVPKDFSCEIVSDNEARFTGVIENRGIELSSLGMVISSGLSASALAPEKNIKEGEVTNMGPYSIESFSLQDIEGISFIPSIRHEGEVQSCAYSHMQSIPLTCD